MVLHHKYYTLIVIQSHPLVIQKSSKSHPKSSKIIQKIIQNYNVTLNSFTNNLIYKQHV
jgi:hypothetical protein